MGRRARRPASSSRSSCIRSSRTRACSRSALAGSLPLDARGGARAARRARAAQRGGHRRVPPRHRSAGVEPASSARCSRSFLRASRTRPRRATISPGCCERSPAIRMAVELRHKTWSDGIGDTLALLNTFGAAWVQIDEPKFRFSIRQNYLPNVKGFYYMRLHGRNADAVVEARQVRGPLQLPVFSGRAEGVHGNGRRGQAARQEALSLHEQSLLREVGRQRGDDQAAARRAGRRRISAGVHRALPRARRRSQASEPRTQDVELASRTFPDQIASLKPRRHIRAGDDLSEYGVLLLRSDDRRASRRSGCRPAPGLP